MLPDEAQLRLHIGCIGSHHDHRVLVGQNDTKLPVLAVATEGIVPTPPKLKAIALIPITGRIGTVGHLLVGR